MNGQFNTLIFKGYKGSVHTRSKNTPGSLKSTRLIDRIFVFLFFSRFEVTPMFNTLIECGMQMGLLPTRKVELGSKMDPSSKKAGYFRLRFITPLGGWSLFQCGFTTPRWRLLVCSIIICAFRSDSSSLQSKFVMPERSLRYVHLVCNA